VKGILIIGKGYIGNSLAKLFQHRNIIHEHIARAEVDYSNSDALFNYLKDRSFIAVVNCTGYTGRPNVDAAERDRELCHLLNVEIPLNIYDVCEKLGINFYHISSGCIYSGYDKLWTEEDAPNFGISCPDASWYSKTKHMAEKGLSTGSCYCIRLRMPFSGINPPSFELQERCLLKKLSEYDKLVNTLNSKTYVPALCDFLLELIRRTALTYNDRQIIYNYACSDPLDIKTIVNMMNKVPGIEWDPEFVEWKDLDIVAKRSNCIISTQKALDDGFDVYSEMDCMREALGI